MAVKLCLIGHFGRNWGGAVAEWSKALLKREKINENQKIPGLPPGLGTFKKKKVLLKELMNSHHSNVSPK